ncbi:METTL5 family protein [Methanocaldococcus sp.]
MKKKKLEMILDSLKPHPNPKVELEQYTINGKLASELLFLAQKDFLNNIVLDLGCGTGRLAIGAKLLGAYKAIGIDIDRESIEIAKENAKKVGVEVEFICEDIKNINKNIIKEENLKKIVLQNPPFGAQKKGADRVFLDKALELGDVIYSIHNYPTKDFVIKYVESKGGKITDIYRVNFRIPATYKFHKKRSVDIPVLIFRIERG